MWIEDVGEQNARKIFGYERGEGRGEEKSIRQWGRVVGVGEKRDVYGGLVENRTSGRPRLSWGQCLNGS